MNQPSPGIEGDEIVADDLVSGDSGAEEEAVEIVEGVEIVDDADDAEPETANSFLEDFQRVSAEFANYRRQTDKRHTELVQQAGSRLAMQLLPVLDAFDAAVTHGDQGVEAIRTQLITVLEREGLQTIADSSEPFDPTRHEAAMHESADDDQQVPMVSEVLRTGYAWNGRVLRAAMVKVKG